jgi:hypothetical protein
MKEKIKLLCLIIDDDNFVDGNVFRLGDIYEGYYYSDNIFGEMWVVYGVEGKRGFHRPLKNFMSLADWREKQINSILDDVPN